MWSTTARRCIRSRCVYPLKRVLSTSARASTVNVTHHTRAMPQRHDDDEDATALVDGLVDYTRQLMKSSQHHVVAYSGGVDSSLVAALLQQAAHDHERHTVLAVLGISPAVSQEQIQQARKVTAFLNVELREVYTTEGKDETYIENQGKACLACKTHLYKSLQAVHRSVDESCDVQQQLYNGTNMDDLQDSTRVGLIAAQNFLVQSPLEHISKEKVRIAARHLSLPNWNAAAAPCLRSRLALGVEATQHHLHMIEKAERFVKSVLLPALDTSSNMRVRMLTNQRAMIEVDEELLGELQLGIVEQAYFSSLGFSSVSARAFRSGSVAAKRQPTSSPSVVVSTTEDAESNREMEAAVAVG